MIYRFSCVLFVVLSLLGRVRAYDTFTRPPPAYLGWGSVDEDKFGGASNSGNGNFKLGCNVIVKSSVPFSWRYPGYTSAYSRAAGTYVFKSWDPANGYFGVCAIASWAGLTSASPRVRAAITPPSPYVIEYLIGGVWRTVSVDPPYLAGVVVAYDAGASFTSNQAKQAADVVITLSGGEPVVENPNVAPPDPPLLHEEMGLLLWNKTGSPQDVDINGQKIHLEPGLNNIRYDGPVDASGLPAALPAEMAGSLLTLDDGKKYFQAELVQNTEGGMGWNNPDLRARVLNSGNGSDQGPTILFQTAAQEAAGSGGLITTLPGGPAPSASNTTSLGDSGAVLSNPTQPKPAPGAAGAVTLGGSIPGGSSVASVASSSGGGVSTTAAASDFLSSAPPALSSLDAAKNSLSGSGDSLKSGVTGITDAIKGFGIGKFWSGDSGTLSGGDASWLRWEFEIPHVGTVAPQIPLEWLAFVRSALLWAGRIWFVLGVIRLLMR